MAEENSPINDQMRYNAALQSLQEIFSLQIPRSVEKIVIRRMLTIAARNEYQKVTPEVAELLKIVGAKPPEMQSHTLKCFGVLFRKDHRICDACGLKESCATEAANVGLGEITLSPKLLGSKQTRIPAVVVTSIPRPESRPGLRFMNERDEELYSYLCENFDKAPEQDGLICFKHRDIKGRVGVIFGIGPKTSVRFYRPSDELAKSLCKGQCRLHTLPTELSTEKSVELINKHAEEVYKKYAKAIA